MRRTAAVLVSAFFGLLLAAGRYFRFDCLTEVEFSPDDTDSVSNCDGQLRRGSSC